MTVRLIMTLQMVKKGQTWRQKRISVSSSDEVPDMGENDKNNGEAVLVLLEKTL